MRTALFLMMVFAAPLVSVAECRTYVAPPESNLAGQKITIHDDFVVYKGQKFYRIEPSVPETFSFGSKETNTAYYNIGMYDDYSAVVTAWNEKGEDQDGEPTRLWPAACND